MDNLFALPIFIPLLNYYSIIIDPNEKSSFRLPGFTIAVNEECFENVYIICRMPGECLDFGLFPVDSIF